VNTKELASEPFPSYCCSCVYFIGSLVIFSSGIIIMEGHLILHDLQDVLQKGKCVNILCEKRKHVHIQNLYCLQRIVSDD
jgi:hypothetical protein